MCIRDRYRETLDQCELADQVGFDNLWFVEHHFLMGFSGSPCPEVMFGALSQRTKNIRIGFGVSILPSHHPIHIAERVAMVDQLTDGRVEFGTGRSNAYEQVGQGVDPRETRERWDESLGMLPQIWQSDEYSHEGKFWSVPSRRVLPRVFQKPHPRMYLACTQTESFRLAAQKGIGVLSSASYAVDILAELGRRRSPGQVVVGFAAETSDVRQNAAAKLAAKGADLIVANDVAAPGVGFGHDTNAVVLLDADGGEREVDLGSKRQVARAVLDAAVELRHRHRAGECVDT